MSVDALLQPIQRLLNRHVQESTVARERLAALDGECLQLQLQGLPFSLYLLAEGESLLLSSESLNEPSAAVQGTLLSGVKFLRGNETVASAGLRIDGDAAVAESFIELLDHARPDLEEELSRFTGDAAAHQIGNALRGARDFARNTLQTLRANTAEYLQEESRRVPPRAEVDAFYEDVSSVRDGVERAAARLDQLRTAVRPKS